MDKEVTPGIEFEEEQTDTQRMIRRKPLPEKGLEGFVYNKIPGKYSYKKAIFIVIIILLFVGSFIFFVLGLKNIGDKKVLDFGSRVENTKSN